MSISKVTRNYQDALESAFGIWGKGPSGKIAQQKLRAGWNKREQAA